MKKLVKFILLCLAISFTLVLSGCGFKTDFEIYLSDLYTYLTGGGEEVFIPITLSIDVGSEDGYNTNKYILTQILSKYFGEVENIRYEQDSSNFIVTHYYVCTVNVPITAEPEGKVISLTVNKNGEVSINFDSELFEALNDEASEYFEYRLSSKESKFIVLLINDMKKEITLEFQGVYVNDEPYPFSNKVVLKNRGKLKIGVSELLRDYLIKQGSAKFMKVYW
ncbi:MAG: hypothetical protein ACK4MM_01150 [Fervidobacterium sp.]